MAASGRQAGSTFTGKLLSWASCWCHSRESAGSSVVHTKVTPELAIKLRALMPGS